MSDNPAPEGASPVTGPPPPGAKSAVQTLAAQLQLPGTGRGQLASLNDAIDDLKSEQQRLKDNKKRLAKELKNAQRRKRRLKGRARQLSNEDLLAVLLMREEGGASSSATAGSSTDLPMTADPAEECRPGTSNDAA